VNRLYAIVVRATLVAAVILGLICVAATITFKAPQMLAWVAVSAVVAWFARSRLPRLLD
jgi:hypothetical protein